jgi:hypothetical protein
MVTLCVQCLFSWTLYQLKTKEMSSTCIFWAFRVQMWWEKLTFMSFIVLNSICTYTWDLLFLLPFSPSEMHRKPGFPSLPSIHFNDFFRLKIRLCSRFSLGLTYYIFLIMDPPTFHFWNQERKIFFPTFNSEALFFFTPTINFHVAVLFPLAVWQNVWKVTSRQSSLWSFWAAI